MQATKANINELFTGTKVFDIPFYQRAYVWDEPQWERLLDDLEDISRTGVPHFIGSVILKQQLTSIIKHHSDVRIVIDGQQRITTLAIFLKVLCLKNDNMKPFNNRFRLDDDNLTIRHNRNDKDAFEKIMNLNTLANIESKDKVSMAYDYFAKKIDVDKLDITAILNSLLFVAIELSESEDEQQIFDTINSLGVRLSTPELLKNYFFSRDDEKTYVEYWQNIFEKDTDTKDYWDITITTGGRERKFIELFFHAFLQIKIQELDIKGDDKKPFQTVDKLFDSYKKLIKDYDSVTKESLLGEIKEFAEIFMETFDTEILASELSSIAGRDRINVLIFHMETTTLVPYVLFIERNIFVSRDTLISA